MAGPEASPNNEKIRLLAVDRVLQVCLTPVQRSAKLLALHLHQCDAPFGLRRETRLSLQGEAAGSSTAGSHHSGVPSLPGSTRDRRNSAAELQHWLKLDAEGKSSFVRVTIACLTSAIAAAWLHLVFEHNVAVLSCRQSVLQQQDCTALELLSGRCSCAVLQPATAPGAQIEKGLCTLRSHALPACTFERELPLHVISSGKFETALCSPAVLDTAN